MPIDKSLKKVMIIGSGPIIIGQAAEFDYSGTQACKAIKEEGIETILVNSNPATIMTDTNVADRVYIEPLNVESLEKIISQEKPDGILAGFGGQTGLNLSMQLKEEGILDKYGVRLLGTDSETIKKAEDREAFKELMLEIDEPIPMSIIATKIKECEDFVEKYGYPVIIRPAYTLGGTGGGIASNYDELIEICQRGIENSPIGQILLEQSVAGWKEIEYEVIRDKKDNCIIICNMENMDPVGVHTGDSIVVAPSQTLRDKEYQMLRQASIKIIRSLKIEGGCNIQFALDPKSNNYIVIEVNPRVSRSSALASKAAGYPIAKIGAKIGIGFSLDELKNYVTKNSSACFEPALDYIVVKFPKWPFDKFSKASRTLGTQMKATGEVMAISRSFESALLKSLTSLEGKFTGLRMFSMMEMTQEELFRKIDLCDDERIFALAEALRRGITVDMLHDRTKIDPWFLNGLVNIIKMETRIKEENMDEKLLYEAKAMGFTDKEISDLKGIQANDLEEMRKEQDIKPIFKMVDTCSGEFDAQTPYYYSCYEEEDENIISDKKKIMVLGSGPIRIGQGIEFDYSCVHGVWAIKEAGYESIIINNNPETVSTDFDTADKLYFESLYIDDVMNVINNEKPEGVILQLGGQTSVNLAEKLYERGVNILGTSYQSMDMAEDRDKFRSFLEELNIPSPTGRAVTSIEEALETVGKLGYPVVVRPSYVIGGRAMQVVYDQAGLENYLQEAVNLSKKYPVLIDKYVKGTEIEVDAIGDGEDILIPGIMEHVERTGVHSGDSITVYPYMTLNKETVQKLVDYTRKIAKGLNVVGLVNIQYVFDGKEVYVIEVNPRASRTVPILSKVTGVPMVKLAVDAMLGNKLKDTAYGTGLMENKKLHAVKVPVFSGEKLADVDMSLGPEMKSTGEVLGIDMDLNKAIYKGFKASGIKIPTKGAIYVSLKAVDKEEGLKVIKDYEKLGFKLYGSVGTANFLKKHDVSCETIPLFEVDKRIADGTINMMINTPTRGNNKYSLGFRIRRKMSEHRLPIFTSIDTARIFKVAIDIEKNKEEITYKTLDEYLK
ncbi:carbamoyl-phosphate synthase (glutamine-hydrolyzing) large subunit [Crassaminicella profunda]|uniref:carbamoyl-phosphate synthase (glutamine-hydrolyzing) large subunit n=1 Tax=Crassaminicella profunda TaxID=1286698 RepID=UPI001CA7644A|nr:carbamoyl-phosphate synthase (glutamine-hydrolyzing) large subunit [Crassaminicella profunda]QZY54977.1 carbamoyl-phosphate synthase (glutamine-hydrolyzing) large subunit [Crassaminicella profunda]